MTGYLTDCGGATWRTPPLFSWDISHGFSSPCDSFEVSFIYSADMLPALKKAVRFRAVHGEKTVFFGVVDEFEAAADYQGLFVTVRGRSLQALLMDNEAKAADYTGADLGFILRRHVTPLGISNIDSTSVSAAAADMTVSSGKSHFSVLSDYLDYAAGCVPRFSREGVLLLNGESGGETKVVGADTPVSAQVYCMDRYGVVSEVLVQNRYSGTSVTMENTDFKTLGGICRRIVSVPKTTALPKLRYTGDYQIRKSMEDFVVCSITVPELFAAFPGDTLEIQSSPLGVTGSFMARETRCWADSGSAGTVIEFAG